MLVGPWQTGLGLGPWQAELLAEWRAGQEHLQAGQVHLLTGLELRQAGLKLCCNVREIQVKLRGRKELVVLSSLKLFYCVEASTVFAWELGCFACTRRSVFFMFDMCWREEKAFIMARDSAIR